VSGDSEIRLFVGTRKRGQCTSGACLQAIDWYTTLNDRGMPMNAGAKPLRVEVDRATGYTIGIFSSRDSHWATCPARSQFSRPWSRTRIRR